MQQAPIMLSIVLGLSGFLAVFYGNLGKNA